MSEFYKEITGAVLALKSIAASLRELVALIKADDQLGQAFGIFKHDPAASLVQPIVAVDVHDGSMMELRPVECPNHTSSPGAHHNLDCIYFNADYVTSSQVPIYLGTRQGRLCKCSTRSEDPEADHHINCPLYRGEQ